MQDVPKLAGKPLPNERRIYDWTLSPKDGAWVPWESTLGAAEIPQGARFSDIIVPTKDMARYTFLLDTAVRHGQPILLTGPTGGVLSLLTFTRLAWACLPTA